MCESAIPSHAFLQGRAIGKVRSMNLVSIAKGEVKMLAQGCLELTGVHKKQFWAPDSNGNTFQGEKKLTTIPDASPLICLFFTTFQQRSGWALCLLTFPAWRIPYHLQLPQGALFSAESRRPGQSMAFCLWEQSSIL